LRWGLAFCPGWPAPPCSYFRHPTATVMKGVCHYAQLFAVEMESWERFLLELTWSYNTDLSSCVAWMTGRYHLTQVTGVSHGFLAQRPCTFFFFFFAGTGVST
jgi:hypothetical protein